MSKKRDGEADQRRAGWRPRIAAIGEVLWDVFPSGPRFGGAPANFACHAAALGADVAMVSCVGDDEFGRTARKSLERHGVETNYLGVSADRPTGTVRVAVDAAGAPSYEICRDVAWDQIVWSESLAQLAGSLDVVCFGVLCQRGPTSRETIQRFVATTTPKAWRVFDINLRQDFYDRATIERSLELANVLKLNEDEWPVLAEMFGCSLRAEQGLPELQAEFALSVVAYTRGGDGSLLIRGDERSQVAASSADVLDTVGAGDSFTAAMVCGLSVAAPLDEINRFASRVAAFVCSRAGATPELPTQFPAELKRLASAGPN